MTDRTEFEKWAADHGYSVAKETVGFRREQYVSHQTRNALEAWQAALSRPSTEVRNAALEEAACLIDDMYWGSDGDCGAADAIRALKSEQQPHSCARDSAEVSQQAITQTPDIPSDGAKE